MERLLNGRYRVGKPLGAGGMAIVYRGFDTKLRREVAIKVLRDQFASDPVFVARFAREAEAVAALGYPTAHPHIVNILDVDTDRETGRRYFVMEYVDGNDLKELIQSRGAASIDDAVIIMTQVLDGLGYAHEHGIVHRDVKPQNILVTRTGTAKVADFGIAKGLSDATLTEIGIAMGTVHYVSPEQARGEPATPASDLYSAGVVLYELLTGALPFAGDSAVGVALRHVQEMPIPPHRLDPDIPTPLSALTMHALAKEPQARFASAREMAAALQHWPEWHEPRAPAAGVRLAAGRTAVAAGRHVARDTAVRTAARQPAHYQAAPPSGARGLGCLTWLVGLVALVALVAVLVVGYRLSPCGAVAAAPTPAAIAGLPSPRPDVPTSTATVAPALASATAPAALPTLVGPVATTTAPRSVAPSATQRPATPVPTATATASPTMTVTPSVTATPTATLTPTAILVAVPALTGKTLEQAQAQATEAGFVAEQVEARYSDQPAGRVIEQRPAANTRAAKGSTVALVVSRGPQAVAVPDVKAQGYESAAAQLERAGLAVARKDVPSRNVPQGIVIDQDPLGGNSVAPGATVTLTVSLGDVVAIPDFFGRPWEAVRQQLSDAGFVVLVNGQSKAQIEKENPPFFAVHPDVKDGQVISQSLPADTYQPRGATIAIAYYKAK